MTGERDSPSLIEEENRFWFLKKNIFSMQTHLE